jgi:hypothetical protein
VSPTKRLLILSALTAACLVGATSASDAQVVVGVGVGPRVGFRGYYSPFFYDPLFYGQWGPYPYDYPAQRYLAADASLRLEVTPKQAEVYVDGFYAGIVDDFNGVFQRLHVAPGNHEIELYLDGYRVVKQQLFLPANDTVKVKYAMEKLAAGEMQEPKPQPMPPQMNVQAGRGYPPQGQYAPQAGAYPPPGAPLPDPGSYQPPPQVRARRTPPPPQQSNGASAAAGYGTLSVRVQPADADVAIDGEAWRGPEGHDRLIVDIAEGSHTVEIRKPGYRTYVTQIDIRRGQTTPLNVSLRTQEQP